MTLDSNTRATLFFGAVLLLFIQTLTTWIESVYKLSLTKLSLGGEAAGLLFVLSPLVVLFWPERRQRELLWVTALLFLAARGALPYAGAGAGLVIGGAGVGAFLVMLCLLLSRPFGFLRGNASVAMGLALLASITLRAWGATYDFTLGQSGALLGWLIVAIALGLFWSLAPTAQADASAQPSPASGALGPTLALFANLTVVYLVLSSPGVVEAWLGFDNTVGPMLCCIALGGALIFLGRGLGLPRPALAVWNLLFAIALVCGIVALRIPFPATPESPAVIVRPENAIAGLLLNVMFLLSPVVLFNCQAACRSLEQVTGARRMSVPVCLGMVLLVLVTMLSIFTNVWGYVGPVSAVCRNQFHAPFLLAAALMTGALFLPGWRRACWHGEPRTASRVLSGLAAALVLAALAGAWHHRPGTTPAAGAATQLTILTYNMQQGAALSGDRNWENQLALLRAINADLVGLQECDTARPSNGNVSAPEYFGARLGYHIYYGPNTVSGTYGTAILSRFPLQNPRAFFTFSDQDEVGTAVAEIKLDGKTFAFFNSHPSGSVPRKRHAQELVGQAMAYEYVIAVGDYNSTPREEPYRTITARLKDSWAERHPDGVGELPRHLRPRGAIRPHASSGKVSVSGDTITVPDRIDHIFLSKRFQVLESFYLPAPASQTDHPAHWTVVAWD